MIQTGSRYFKVLTIHQNHPASGYQPHGCGDIVSHLSVGLITNNLQSLPLYISARAHPLFVRACWIAAFNKLAGPGGIFSVNLVRVPEKGRKRTTLRDPEYFTRFSCSAIFTTQEECARSSAKFSPLQATIRRSIDHPRTGEMPSQLPRRCKYQNDENHRRGASKRS